MAIIRCTKCAHLAERADGEIGLLLACPRCGNRTPVYPTLFFVTRLLEKYFAARHQVTRLNVAGGSDTATVARPADATALPVAVDRTAGSEQNPPDEMARGLSAMYDLSFVSERGLSQHLARLL
jgi:predicted  nucleic acid-binding Zn-ribbon protein